MSVGEIEEIINSSPVIKFKEIYGRVNSKEYAKQVVYRLIKKGNLKRIKKGVYSNSDDIFSIASNIYYPSYISFLSASYKLGLTEVIPIAVYVVTTKNYAPIEFERYKIIFIESGNIFGYHKEGKDKNVVFLADSEKLMVDALFKPEHMGNFDEIINVFKNSKNIEKTKVIEYLNQMNSNKISRQVGYLLEMYQNMDISESVKINKNYYDLNPFEKGKKINKKWRLKI
ncbi:hypothetical protein KO465_03310 [Candidatus Micrarchaeota archaeon]|nr:hypothetical protein [Candidatus Micrarchaeota archaeon]